MGRVLLSQLPDWNVVDQDADIRGLRLVSKDDQVIGLILDLIVDTDSGYVDALVLDTGQEVSANDIELGKGIVYLRQSMDNQLSASPTAQANSLFSQSEHVEHQGTLRVEEPTMDHTETAEQHMVEVSEQQPFVEAFQEGVFEVFAHSEVLDITKQSRIVEEIHLNKHVVERVETVSTNVRRLRVEVEERVGPNPTAQRADAHVI